MKTQVIMLIPLLLVTTMVDSARVDGKREYTSTFTNLVDSLFLNYTHLPSFTGINPCAPVKSRSAYISLLARYGITSGNEFADYQMEHIIDKSNTPYSGNKDIAGNLVMSNPTWNNQIGQMNWSMVEREKRIVYRAIFDKALKSVVECSGGTYSEDGSGSNSKDEDDGADDILSILLSRSRSMIFFAFFLITIVVATILFISRTNQMVAVNNVIDLDLESNINPVHDITVIHGESKNENV